MAAKKKRATKKPRRTLGDVSALRCSVDPTYVGREPLDRGGYTSGGMYFGVGAPLYSFSNRDSHGYLRAASKAAAKKKILAKCPMTTWVK